MKDYYYKLGIEPDATEAEIQKALAQHPDAGDCSAILLDPEKRSTYDELHSTLTAIAVLRHRLGLDQDESWFLEHCGEFATRNRLKHPVNEKPQPRQDEMQQYDEYSSEVQTPGPDRESNSGKLVTLGVFVAAAVLALLAWVLL